MLRKGGLPIPADLPTCLGKLSGGLTHTAPGPEVGGLADHVTNEVAVAYERHEQHRFSARFCDLVDPVAVAPASSASTAQKSALTF